MAQLCQYTNNTICFLKPFFQRNYVIVRADMADDRKYHTNLDEPRMCKAFEIDIRRVFRDKAINISPRPFETGEFNKQFESTQFTTIQISDDVLYNREVRTPPMDKKYNLTITCTIENFHLLFSIFTTIVMYNLKHCTIFNNRKATHYR